VFLVLEFFRKLRKFIQNRENLSKLWKYSDT